MADIAAFRGIRYDLGHVGSLADVTAPPYDVIDGDQQDVLYKRHPANCVRLILNRSEPGDAGPGDAGQGNRYIRAARFLRNWLREGVLFRESDPAVYVYHQTFKKAESGKRKSEGGTLTRRGFIARVRIEPFGEGNIYPHEETHTGAKADRLKLWRACKANLSSIFGMYPDKENTAQGLLEAAVIGQTPIEATDDDGTIHRLWPVTDVAVISELTGAMGGRPIYIADGHHRYETAVAYRDALEEKGSSKKGSGAFSAKHPPGRSGKRSKKGSGAFSAKHPPGRSGKRLLTPFSTEHPANHVLMTCVSMNDPGLLILPTHRLFRGLPPMTAGELTERLGECFEVESAVGSRQGIGLKAAEQVWEEVELEGEQGTLAFYTTQDEAWTIARITEAGRARLAEIAPERSEAWRSLGVSILHKLVIDELLDGANMPTPKYVRALDELIHDLEQGDATGRDATGQQGSGGRFELAALVMPAGLEQIRSVCGQGERMPAKSTYFYPKILSGLVINPLE